VEQKSRNNNSGKTDNETTIRELKEKVRNFCEARDWDQFHNAKELALGIITEASELLQQFRFKSHDQANEMFQNKLKKQEFFEEISNILFFVLRLAQRYDIDLSVELENKIKKNGGRYPVHKAKGSNKKYTEY